MKILVCNPAFYNVTYKINPWMSPEKGINFDLAVKQWQDLISIFKDLGVEVCEMSGELGLPDIVFTANAGVLLGEKRILLSNFKYPERKPEKQVYKKWFEENGYTCEELPEEVNFEGAGDVLLRKMDKTSQFCMGFGFRSDISAYGYAVWSTAQVLPQNNPDFNDGFFLLRLVDPYFYHLDTCFCPLPRNYALIYKDAFDSDDFNLLKDSYSGKLLEVSSDEAHKFACNSVSVENTVVMPSGCIKTRQMLEKHDFEVRDTDMSQYLCSGGACRCLCFNLD